MRRELRRYRSAILLILAFTLGLGAQLLQAQVSVSPGRYRFGATIAPSTNDGAALGTASLSWSDLFLASGAVINAGNGEMTLTFAADSATLAGGQFLITSAANPAIPDIAGSAASTTGITFALGNLYFSTAANARMTLSDSTLAFASGVGIKFGDTFFAAEATDIIQQGDDAATPAAQIYKGPDARAGTDTDTAGGDITFAAGRSTGTGAPGNIYFSTGATNAPGTAAGPLTRRLQIASSGQTIIASHTRFNVASSTTGSGSALLGGNAPIGQVSAPYVWIAVIASDGTAAWIPAWR